MGKLVLLGGHDELPPRSAGWAQLVLVEPVLAMRGDRFILREETARRTLGGGVVVNPFADRHRRAEAGLEERLEVLRGGEPPAAGLEMESLRTQLPWDVPPRVFRWCIERLAAARRLVREESVVRAPGHRVALGAAAHALGARVERLLAEGRFTPPDLRQLEEATGAPRKALVDLLGVLEADGRVARIAPDLYWARRAADEARALLEAHCRAHGEITAALFRDLIGASRKFAIAFLDWCDRTGVTI